MGEIAYCISSSSEEEDGDAERKAAINYLATDVSNQSADSNGPVPKTTNRTSNSEEKPKSKHYVVQKLLEDMLDKSLEMVNAPIPECDDEPAVDEGDGIPLFRHAPLGIVFDPVDDSKLPRKMPKILPRYEVVEKSEKDACNRSKQKVRVSISLYKVQNQNEKESITVLLCSALRRLHSFSL
ncbi:hypothetical protein MKW92_027221 [Papaver armeniacum]|nr:hypothetical protein MKW92_027221 [Papaver armeniacum]